MARPTVTLEVRFASAPFTDSGTWTDISAYCQAIEIQTGRTYELDRFTPGRATFTLRDTTRRFDPEWTSGAWFGQLTPGKQIRCRATYNAVTYDLFRGYVSDWGAASIPDADKLYRNVVTAFDALAQFESVGLPASWLELAIQTDSPAHWWRLDESTGDVAVDYGTGTRNDGHYLNSPELADTEVVARDAGRRAPLFSTGQGVTAALESGTPETIELWFIRSAVPSSTEYLLSGNPTSNLLGTNVAGWALGLQGGTGYWRLETFGSTAANSLTGSTNLADGLPHQIAAIGTNNNTWAIYVDGTLIDTSAFAATTGNNPTGSIFIGGDVLTNLSNFAGNICQVAVWFSALSGSDILDHYTAGARGYTGTDTGAMLALLLDYKGWPSTLRTLATGTSIIGSYDLPSRLAEFVGRMSDTEAGQTYVSGDGKVTHRNRHLWLDSRSRTSQATFGDLHGSATLQYAADGFLMPLDEQQIRNPVYAARADGVTAAAQDTTLISSTYGERGYNAPTAYDSSDNVMVDRAGYYLSRFKTGKTRLKAMRLTPERSGALLYPQALGRVIGDRITVKRKPLNTGNETSLDFIIEGVRHVSTPEAWETTFWGSQAETTGWILDDATYSVLDTTTTLTY